MSAGMRNVGALEQLFPLIWIVFKGSEDGVECGRDALRRSCPRSRTYKSSALL
jgi:hypothetical protein